MNHNPGFIFILFMPVCNEDLTLVALEQRASDLALYFKATLIDRPKEPEPYNNHGDTDQAQEDGDVEYRHGGARYRASFPTLPHGPIVEDDQYTR